MQQRRLGSALDLPAQAACAVIVSPQTVRKIPGSGRSAPTTTSSQLDAFPRARATFRRQPTTPSNSHIPASLFELYYDI
jgi:hypothetical protein